MVHKLRDAMGKRNTEYVLAGRIELDERYFSIKTPVEAKDKPLRRGRGSQRKTRVIVMAESEFVESVREGQKPRCVGYLQMKEIDNLKSDAINEHVKMLAYKANEIDMDGSTFYVEMNLDIYTDNYLKF